MIDNDKLITHVEQHPFPLMFATISGAHLYGFPSPDSDFDLRGVHLLPLRQIVGLGAGRETVEKEGIYDGLEIDLRHAEGRIVGDVAHVVKGERGVQGGKVGGENESGAEDEKEDRTQGALHVCYSSTITFFPK